MSTIQNSVDPATVQLLVTGLIGCLGLVNAFFFFILRGIKKNIDEQQERGRKDHDKIIVLETELRNLKEKDMKP